MIQLQKFTPEVYYNHSRDFQFIGRLYDIVLNATKTNADMLKNISHGDNFNLALIDLLSYTLGFKPKHKYNTRQLRAICEVFPLLLKNKGNIQSINIAGQALLSAEGILEEFNSYVEGQTIYVFIPSKLSDINLFLDLLSYILPAGMSCEVIRGVLMETSISTEVAPKNDIKIKVVPANAVYEESNDMTSSTLFGGLPGTTTNSDEYNKYMEKAQIKSYSDTKI